MTWATFKKWSRGELAFRLEVEGWPHEWVTDPAVTHQLGRDSRTVYAGLQYSGLRTSERAIMRDAWFEVGGMTVTLKPSTWKDDTLMFTRDATPVDYLGGADGLSESDTTITTLSGNNLPTGFYHTATECFFSDGIGGITRGEWGTTPQVHHTHGFDGELEQTPIYAWPPTMEGRRATLYGYARGDDFAGDGTFIWRGIVSRPPRMERDGISWTIQIDPISKALEQEIHRPGRAWRPRGVYHSESAPFYVMMTFGHPAGAASYDIRFLQGFYETNEVFAAAVTDLMAMMLSDAGYTRLELRYEIRPDPDGAPRLVVTTGATLPADTGDNSFTLQYGAVQEGYVERSWFEELKKPGGSTTVSAWDAGTAKTWANLAANTIYYYDAPQARQYFPSSVNTPYQYPLPPVRTILGVPTWVNGPAQLRPPFPDGTNPPFRLYLDGDVSALAVDDMLLLETPVGSFQQKVLALDATAGVNYVDIEWRNLLDPLFLTGDTKVTLLRTLPTDGNIGDFMQAVVSNSKFANDGDVPFITANDVADWRDTVALAGNPYLQHRVYRFSKPVSVKTIAQEELKALALFPRLDVDGKVSVARLPELESHTSPEWTLTDTDILLPAAGYGGTWPQWEEQADGIVNTVKVRLGYKPDDDSFDELLDTTVARQISIAEHKTRGKGEVEIAPRSLPSSAWNLATVGNAFAGVLPLTARLGSQDIVSMVAKFLNVLSRDYALVTIPVSYRFMDVLVGSTGVVTSKFIPDGTGKRGVVGRRAFVVGKDRNFDPSSQDQVTLTLYMPRSTTVGVGYTPAGYVDTQTNTSGDDWDLTFDPINLWNLLFSESHDGNIVTHFAVGDRIRLVQDDVFVPVHVEGTITATGTNSISVELDATWTPGPDRWVIRYQPATDGALTAHQKNFCYVANSSALLADGSIARGYR